MRFDSLRRPTIAGPDLPGRVRWGWPPQASVRGGSILVRSLLACSTLFFWSGTALDAQPVVAETNPASGSSLTEVVDKTNAVRAVRPGWYLGRQIAPTMSASGAEWLTRKSRENEEEPQKLLRALQLRPKQQVCDFGCGNGYYTLQLAKRVGPRGIVFAVDIQQEMLTLLTQRSKPRGLNNIKPVLATLTDPKLPQRQLDLVLMVDVYHELSHPEPILQAIYASLNDTGRIAIVEFREEDREVPILPLHKMSQPQVMKEICANGFKLVGQFDSLPWQHVLFFAREDSVLAEHRLEPWQAEAPVPATSSPPSSGALPPETDGLDAE